MVRYKHFSTQEKSLLWERWRDGDSLREIARLLERRPASVFKVLRRTGSLSITRSYPHTIPAYQLDKLKGKPMNDDRLHDLLIEVHTGNVNISDNQADYDDWKFLIDTGLVEHSKPRGSAGSRTKTIILSRLTDSGKQQLSKLQAT